MIAKIIESVASKEWSDELIEKTIALFRPRAEALGRDFSREDAIESINNVVALFEFLIELDRRQKKAGSTVRR